MEEIYKEFSFDFLNRRKVLLSSFHLNGHTLGFYSQTQNVRPTFYYTQTVPKKFKISNAQCFSLEW